MKNVSMIAVAMLATILTTGCQKTVEKEEPADLRLFELTGNVKNGKDLFAIDVNEDGTNSDEWTQFPGGEYTFDENGTLISYSDNGTQATITRDEAGRIISMKVACENADGSWNDGGFEVSYSWDENGKLTGDEYHNCVGGHMVRTYIYDNNGQIVGSNGKGMAEGETYTVERKYRVLESDEKGNWTKRHVTTTETYEGIEPDVTYELETREITYFE